MLLVELDDIVDTLAQFQANTSAIIGLIQIRNFEYGDALISHDNSKYHSLRQNNPNPNIIHLANMFPKLQQSIVQLLSPRVQVIKLLFSQALGLLMLVVAEQGLGLV